jgi:hypothetical protein
LYSLFEINKYSAATRSQICPKSHNFSRIRDANSSELIGIRANSHESRKFVIAFFEISYHKNCSNDENISKKASRIREKSCEYLREFGRFRANL